jgi:signal transduction histidine kinase/CheY-like chemotaxis protein
MTQSYLSRRRDGGAVEVAAWTKTRHFAFSGLLPTSVACPDGWATEPKGPMKNSAAIGLALFFILLLSLLYMPSRSFAASADVTPNVAAVSHNQSLWFQRNIEVVLFVYGLAFVLMGVIILVKHKKESGYDLATILWLLAAFGVTHGIHEFTELWMTIKGRTAALNSAGLFFLCVSFWFLLEFGKQLCRLTSAKKPLLQRGLAMLSGWWSSAAVVALTLVVSLLSGDLLRTGHTLVRYFLGFPGSLLTGFGFLFYYENRREKLDTLGVRTYFILTASSFLVYAFLSGLIAEKSGIFPSTYLNTDSFASATGIPPQVFRTICAVVVALSMGKILTLFDVEVENQLFACYEQLEDKVKERTAMLTEANAQLTWEISEHRRTEGERKKLEQQLLQAQKMEAIGQLAGGIAHDFNNILSVILGYGEMVRAHYQEDDPIGHHVDMMVSAAEKGAHLTQNLLTFGRKQMVTVQSLDLNETVKSVENFLARIIGEDIELELQLSGSALMTMADGNQIEQVLVNICTNARDAMLRGGRLIIKTEAIDVDEEFARMHLFESKGRYALISISDTGSGMDERTREKIFEPFFTTKAPGRGTGLGLAIVYGIIRQHHGYINVYSEPGRGTTFKIFLPLVKQMAQEKEKVLPAPRGGTERILLAEDDRSVRDLMRRILEKHGYTVFEATNGKEAVRIFGEKKEGIDMILLDMIMPIMNGKEAYREIRKLAPNVKAVFISGYAADLITKEELLDARLDYIQKPIVTHELLTRIRTALEVKDPA